MSRFPSLPPTLGLADVFSAFPRAVWPLLEYHDTVLRGPSPLSVAERELLAAYVSTLNACGFCAGAHRIVAEVHGVDPDLLEGLLADPAHPAVDARLRPLLEYVRKLTIAPASVRDADADAVYAAGWNEQALFDAISVCALFNFMNRIVEGCGIVTNPDVQAEQRARHMQFREDPETYRKFGRRLGLDPAGRTR